MKVLKQLALICAFCIIGDILSLLIKLIIPIIFIPGALIGMILLFIALYTRLIKIDWIDDVGTFFVNNMGFFFVPAAVSIMQYFDIIKDSIVKLLLVVFISFFITFSAIILSVKYTLIIQEKIEAKKNKEEQNE